MTSIVVPARFNGPPASGHGGYSCGVFAEALGSAGAATVTLRSPPPLDTPMELEPVEDGVRIRTGDVLVAEAAPSAVVMDVPEPVSYDDARAASRPPAAHPFPTCFACGPARDDGLALFASPIGGRELLAAPWIPRPDTTGARFVWAALDCPGGWTSDRGLALLGRLEGRVLAVPAAGERCVVIAWPLGDPTDRKWHAGTAVFGEDGGLCGYARSTWIVPRG